MFKDKLVVKACYRGALFILTIITTLVVWKVFEGKFNVDSFIYFTHLSNLFVMVMIGWAFVSSVLEITERKFNVPNIYYKLKNIAFICIMLTFLVYNILLGDIFSVEYWTFNNVAQHFAIPLLFVLDYFLFDKKGYMNLKDPFIMIIVPAVYAIYIFIRAATYGEAHSIKYPYFFLNYDELGIGGIVMWVAILVIGFVVFGYGMYFLDKKLAAVESRNLYSQ